MIKFVNIWIHYSDTLDLSRQTRVKCQDSQHTETRWDIEDKESQK